MANNEETMRLQLSLMSAQDTAAARDIAASVQQIATMMKAFKASDFRDAAKYLSDLHKQMVSDTDRIKKEAEALRARTPEAQAVQAAAAILPTGGATPREIAARLRDEADKQTKLTQDKERSRFDQQRQTDAERAAQHNREIFQEKGLPVPNLYESSSKYDRSNALNPNMGGLKIPQYGNITMQDALAQASGALFDRALRPMKKDASEEEIQREIEASKTALDRSMTIDRISRGLGYAYGAQRGIQRMIKFASTQGFNPGDMGDTGAQLGFRRDMGGFAGIGGNFNIPGTHWGINTPFSSAGEEGLRQAWNTQALRAQSGINGQQAQKIVNASAAAGFSGDVRGDIATQFMAPLFRRFGLDPETLIPFTQVLRTGTASVADLSRELGNAGEEARAAKMDIATYTQSLAQSGEAAQQLGGSFMAGVRFGKDFSSSTGLGPDVGNRLLQNPIVQANLGGITGLPSFAQGLASPLAKEQAMRQALQQMVSGFDGTLPTTRSPIYSNGKIVDYETTSGHEAAIGAAAGKLGLNIDEARKLLRGQSDQRVRQNLNAELRQYGGESHGRENKVVDLDAFNHMGIADRAKVIHSGELPMKWTGKDLNTHRWDLVKKMAQEVGVSQSDIDAAGKKSSRHDRIQAIQKAISEKQIEDRADTHIAFTGPAAKFFKALVNKEKGANSLQSAFSSAELATTPGGSQNLSDTSNSGLSP